MDKQTFITLMEEAGDAVINYINNAGKLKYLVGTTDFQTKYIRDKVKPEITHPDLVLVYSWDTDKFKKVNVKAVTRVTAMRLNE